MERDSGNPQFVPRRVVGEELTSRLYGVEIELDYDCEDADYAEALAEIDSEDWHAKADGSLSDNGIECVSQPASLLWWQSKDWTSNALPLELDSNWQPTHKCGMHIHAQCPTELLPDVWRIWNSCPPGHEGQYMALSKRTSYGQMNQYANPQVIREPGQVPTRVRHAYNVKYRACRLTPEGIEVRIFGSTRAADTIVTNITLVALSIRFAKQIRNFR